MTEGVELVEDGVAPWMKARLPSHAIPVERELPPSDRDVMVWISDAAVAIHHYPTVARRSGTAWWAGVPGKWIALHELRWTVTHWLPLPTARRARTTEKNDG